MIARLRRRHRIAAFALWLLVPAVAWFGSARTLPPTMDVIPGATDRADPLPTPGSWTTADAASGIRTARVDQALWIDPGELPRRPDVLVYWLAAAPPEGDGVPEAARLIGRLGGARPVAVASPPARGGGLLFFSLGHQERLLWLPLGAEDE